VCSEFAQRVFRMWDKVNHIAYEGYDLDSVKDGDTIQARTKTYFCQKNQITNPRARHPPLPLSTVYYGGVCFLLHHALLLLLLLRAE
jgi:hypothetical protein